MNMRHMMTPSSSAFLVFLTMVLMRDAFATQVTITYFEKDVSCATAANVETETDPIGSCTTEALSEGSTMATIDSTDTITFKQYTSSDCSGTEDATTCQCDAACCTSGGLDYDFTVDCASARDALTEQVTIEYYDNAQCSGSVGATETDQVDVCTKEAGSDHWSFISLSGSTATVSLFSADGCSSADRTAQGACGCSDSCCDVDGTYFKLTCPASATSSTSSSAAISSPRLHVFGGVLLGAFYMVVSSIWL